jgi:NifU-like protein involved in Fe-S cluster formation
VYSAATIEHALSLRHAGSAGPGAVVGEAGRSACGDAIRIELTVSAGTITVARHRSFGCPHATAAAELACTRAEGRDLLGAARIGVSDLEAVLEPREQNRECVLLAVDAMHAALAAALGSA